MITLLAALSAAALAGGMHAGLPIQGHPDLGPAEFLAPDAGWTAPILADGAPVGMIRVYVGPTPASASAWCQEQARAVQLALPPLSGLGDEAWAVGDALALVRDGNVGIAVQLHEAADGEAVDRARALVAAIEDAPAAWPQAPRMRQQDGLTFFEAPGAAHLQVDGGRRPIGESWGYEVLPSRVVAWDAWGRAAVLTP